jgi:hypothetical protein
LIGYREFINSSSQIYSISVNYTANIYQNIILKIPAVPEITKLISAYDIYTYSMVAGQTFTVDTFKIYTYDKFDNLPSAFSQTFYSISCPDSTLNQISDSGSVGGKVLKVMASGDTDIDSLGCAVYQLDKEVIIRRVEWCGSYVCHENTSYGQSAMWELPAHDIYWSGYHILGAGIIGGSWFTKIQQDNIIVWNYNATNTSAYDLEFNWAGDLNNKNWTTTAGIHDISLNTTSGNQFLMHGIGSYYFNNYHDVFILNYTYNNVNYLPNGTINTTGTQGGGLIGNNTVVGSFGCSLGNFIGLSCENGLNFFFIIIALIFSTIGVYYTKKSIVFAGIFVGLTFIFAVVGFMSSWLVLVYVGLLILGGFLFLAKGKGG